MRSDVRVGLWRINDSKSVCKYLTVYDSLRLREREAQRIRAGNQSPEAHGETKESRQTRPDKK